MSDEATTPTVDVSGIARTTDGTLATPGASTPTTTPAQTTPSDGKPSLLNQTETKPEAGETKPDASKEAEGAPEAYADYKIPDGFELDAEVKGKADTLFKGMNLTQDQAQSLVDFYVENAQEAFNAPYEAFKEMSDRWVQDTMNHPDLRGKLGPGKEVTVRVAKLLDGLPDQALARDFRNIMDITAAGNHPAFIRVLDYFAQKLTEGTHVSGNGPSQAGQSAPGQATKPSAAAAMYPNLPSVHSR